MKAEKLELVGNDNASNNDPTFVKDNMSTDLDTHKQLHSDGANGVNGQNSHDSCHSTITTNQNHMKLKRQWHVRSVEENIYPNILWG